MPNSTNENKIAEKLEYIGLDLAKIPSFLKKKETFEYKPRKTVEESNYKVYGYIPVSKIQILLTPCNRLNTIIEKYSKADFISSYLDAKSEENIIKYTTFLKMLNEVEISKIEEISQEQKKLQKKLPFLVKYQRNYLWQIYYSDTTDTYFMLVPTEDLDYSAFFYLLKKQIEIKKTKKEEWIFTPISHEDYSGQYLKKSQMEELEKYMWKLTQNWVTTYEVYDKDKNISLQIVGKVVVYDGMESDYKINLKTKEEAEKFYKLIKALFILETELPHYYQFATKINAHGGLEFEYQKKKITYDKLMELLVKEYDTSKKTIEELQGRQENLQTQLKQIKQENYIKEQEYLAKERLIATYLECRKTFLGKVKYFFKAKKLKKQSKEEKQEIVVKENKEQDEGKKETITFTQKEYYTIEDILQICKKQDEILQITKKMGQDLEAQRRKHESLTKKIENASLYLAEIDEHEKSIFEFWRFANKDEKARLEAPTENLSREKKLEKVFDYKEDYEEIATLIDKNQRKYLTKEQTDAIFIASTELLSAFQYKEETQWEESLQKLKKEAEKERILFNQENFDLFGNVAGNSTKVQLLGGKKHREVKKDKLKILDVTKNLSLEEYKDKMLKILKEIEETLRKSLSPVSIPVYCALEEEIEKTSMKVFSMKLEEAIKKEEEKKEIQIYRLNIKEKMPVLYFTNGIYYDNHNKTLPLGMNLGSKCLVNVKDYELELKKKDDFRFVKVEEEWKVTTTKVNVYEYEVRRRDEND